MKTNYRLHYRHPDRRIVGDVMPFYHDNRFHIFYLLNGSGHDDINHEHVVTSNLQDWTYVGPSITHEDNCAFTGSYIQTPDKTFHCFFTRWNPENPRGRERIGHAFSHDLVTWTKTDMDLVPDGLTYSNARYRDFRDPCVFFDNASQEYHMFLLANSPKKENTKDSWDENWIQGHYKSRDLVNWIPLEPLGGNFADECPDYIKGPQFHYIHGCHRFAISNSKWGPYHTQEDYVLDKGLRAAKICPVGDRILWFGGFIGGSITLPREIVFLKSGKLGLRISAEVRRLPQKTVYESFSTLESGRFNPEEAHLVSLDIKKIQKLALTLDDKMQFLIENGKLTFIDDGKKTILDDDLKTDNVTDLIEFIIDGDLVEMFWCGKGAFTVCAHKQVLRYHLSSSDFVNFHILSFLP